MYSVHGDDSPMRFLCSKICRLCRRRRILSNLKAAGSAERRGMMFAVSGNAVTPRAYAEHSQRQAVLGRAKDRGSCELACDSKKQ